MKLWLLFGLVFISACAGTGKGLPSVPVFGTKEALETELAAVKSELEQLASLNLGASERIKQYRRGKAADKESRIIEAEAQIHNNEMRRATLLKRKSELEAQIARQR